MAVEWTNADIERYITHDLGVVESTRDARNAALLQCDGHYDDSQPGFVAWITSIPCQILGRPKAIDGLSTKVRLLKLPRFAEVMQVFDVGGVSIEDCYICDPQENSYRPISADDYLFPMFSTYNPIHLLIPADNLQVHENGQVDLTIRALRPNNSLSNILFEAKETIYKHFTFEQGFWRFDTVDGGGGSGTKSARS